MMGIGGLGKPEAMKQMAEYFERIKAENDAAVAKASLPCTLHSNGKHRWQGHIAIFGGYYQSCDCGARIR